MEDEEDTTAQVEYNLTHTTAYMPGHQKTVQPMQPHPGLFCFSDYSVALDSLSLSYHDTSNNNRQSEERPKPGPYHSLLGNIPGKENEVGVQNSAAALHY